MTCVNSGQNVTRQYASGQIATECTKKVKQEKILKCENPSPYCSQNPRNKIFQFPFFGTLS